MKLAWEGLHACGGCEATFLDLGPQLATILQRLDIVHMTLLHDHRHQRPEEPEIPAAAVGVVSGGVALESHRRLLQAMRRSCRLLIALGTCATHGGIPALMNCHGMERGVAALSGGMVPEPNVIAPLDRVYSVDELVEVDLLLPGCPPDPEQVADLLEHLLDGRELAPGSRSVCESCPAIRTGAVQENQLQRFCRPPARPQSPDTESMHCLLEQGYLCLGPVTAGGCGGDQGPHCIRMGVPCRGCLGPVQGSDNQMLAMLNILASKGVDFHSILDRRALLRFTGAHGRLRPVRKNHDH